MCRYLIGNNYSLLILFIAINFNLFSILYIRVKLEAFLYGDYIDGHW